MTIEISETMLWVFVGLLSLQTLALWLRLVVDRKLAELKQEYNRLRFEQQAHAQQNVGLVERDFGLTGLKIYSDEEQDALEAWKEFDERYPRGVVDEASYREYNLIAQQHGNRPTPQEPPRDLS